jgi:hypothetical protein
VPLTVEPDVQAVRIEVTVPAGNDRLAIYRVGPSGTRAYVRAYTEAAVSPGAVIARDFEAPLAVPLTYTAEVWAAPSGAVTTIALGTLTIEDGGCEDTWLTDLVRAGNTQRITMEHLDALDYDVPTGVHRVLNRRTPIVTSDVAWAPSFAMAFLTEDAADRERARACLGNGVPVLLRTPPANGIGSLYFSVQEWSEERIVRSARVQGRRFSVACVQVDRPNPLLFAPEPPTTYAQVEAAFADYAELLAERENYDAVLYDYAGTEAADVVPWPPSDV